MSRLLYSLLISTMLLGCESYDNQQGKIKNLEMKVDSLESVVDSIKILPYLDERSNFQIALDSSHRVKLVAGILNEISIDSIRINGERMDLEKEVIEMKNDEFGPTIIFHPKTTGSFDLVAYARFRHWGNKVVPLSWPITVVANVP